MRISLLRFVPLALTAASWLSTRASPAWASPPSSRLRAYVEAHCLDCHDGPDGKAGLDLARLGLGLDDRKTFSTWVKVWDRVQAGEMPPSKAGRPRRADTNAFLVALADPLVAADAARAAAEGRATRRRLNRYEYENTLRDLFGAPWLQVKATLPDDGVAHRYNKVGDALDVSHVQLAQYMTAAENAIRDVLGASLERPAPQKTRYYARDMRSMVGPMKFSEFNMSPERATFPTLGFSGQPDVRREKQPITAGEADPAARDQEGMGVAAGAYEPLEPTFDRFFATRAGRYRITLMAHSVWVGPMMGEKWWRPDLDTVSKGRRAEPITLYAEAPPRLLRRLGGFDAGVEPTAGRLEVHLLPGETIRPDPARLFRSRPPNYHNPLAERDGQPGVVYRWLEVEGPLVDEWPPAGRKLLFGELPIEALPDPAAAAPVGPRRRSRRIPPPPRIRVGSEDPKGDARRLLRGFVAKAYREVTADEDTERFVAVVDKALDAGVAFADAMIAGYVAVLCSPRFVYLDDAPGALSSRALAARLSYFLWNSTPDAALLAAADRGELGRPEGLRAQALRLLADSRSGRFVDAFLDYWLDLRKMDATGPDPVLYPDYYLDDLLTESAAAETQAFFTELVDKNLPARNVVASDFAMLNERLAIHYQLPATGPGKTPLGLHVRRVPLPPGSTRGGLITQASVLKVTANGTTTSPVLRGVWINERILGREVPPPPPGVPAVEPDIRGASTIREQLDKHRADKSCAACHTKIDPAGFALESFDILGGQRTHYRALGQGGKAPTGWGKNGQPFEFYPAQPVDPSGRLPSGAAFRDVVGLKRAVLRDERQIARNLARQLLVYATGAPVRFGDRDDLERILDQAAGRSSADRYGVRNLILAVVGSDIFKRK